LQPDYEQTIDNFALRMLGTIVAAALATVLLADVHNQYIMALIIGIPSQRRAS
jgi:fusaric acid resistance family protein